MAEAPVRLAQAQAMMGIKQQTANNGTLRANFYTDPNAQAEKAREVAAATTPFKAGLQQSGQTAKADQAAVNGLIANGQSAADFMHQNQSVLAAINANQGLMGPGLVQNVKRQLAQAFPNMDIGDANSADMGMLKKSIAGLTVSQVHDAKGAFGSRITNADLAQIKQMAPQIDTDPNAARTILTLLNQKAAQQKQLWDQYNANPDPALWNQASISQRQGAMSNELLNGGGATRNSDGTWGVGGATVKFH
jgi:hypothetical protein